MNDWHPITWIMFLAFGVFPGVQMWIYGNSIWAFAAGCGWIWFFKKLGDG